MEKVRVRICGEDYTLRSNEDEAYLQNLAHYVERKIEDLQSINTTAAINERVRTHLVALNIADDYFKANDRVARMSTEQEKYINEIGRMQQENMLLRERFHELQAEHARLQTEHDEFLREFDEKQNDNVNVLTLHKPEQRKAR